MTRLLVNQEWYEQIAPSALYESEYERLVFQHAPTLYPDYQMLPFKLVVESDIGSAKPDAVLIEKSFREWWVVEIEMSHHSLNSHVLPQVETLASGYYQTQHAEYLAQRGVSLDPQQIKDMIKGRPPRVLVIANAPVPDWVTPLGRYNALVAIFEIFRSDRNRHIFRINGSQPTAPSTVISECYFDKLLPNCLIVDAPAALDVRPNENVTIRYDGFITEWTRLDAQERVWLVPVKANPLRPAKRYELVQQENGDLLIQEK